MGFSKKYILAFLGLWCWGLGGSQLAAQGKDPVYVDGQGVLRWTRDKKEAAFFGVNYTVPFAYGYRSHLALGVKPEQAIDQDVYHLARLGLDAFRVHVWDTEITDSTGNLLDNEHLRLFDYLIFKLKERNIKILVTPIAYWGPGYPERDEKTLGFSSFYPKARALVHPSAIKSQENYLRQFFRHVNPYTKMSYQADPDILATEVNNEPHHSGPKPVVTDYVNRMVQAIRGTGWTKPIFYNISESPRYADAVAKANVQGHSFQWYPSGLVANRTLPGNFLPHVDTYHIPFDTIPQYRNRARMVYEFDAGDILQPVMYPAMARSFRTAGFQWATQFAYDPLATAYGNTEYQTHFVNLAYTPAKAISLLIAGKVFHQVPRGKKYGVYPQDSVFDAFRVSYRQGLSQMNTPLEFYYSNTTTTKPAQVSKLKHLAGVGNSPVVQYGGTGAYFLDKVSDGVWRLEVMPDAIFIRDPFEKASPQKEVSRLQWQNQPMRVSLPDLRQGFQVRGMNTGNTFTAKASGNQFEIKPGTYLLIRSGRENKTWAGGQKLGALRLDEFVAPAPVSHDPFVVHKPHFDVSPGQPFVVKARITGLSLADKVNLQLNNQAAAYRTIPMERVSAYDFQATVPAEVATPGLVNYRILVQQANGKFFNFPGGYTGDPWAWNYYQNDTWQTFVAASTGVLELFNATRDRQIVVYPNLWRAEERQLLPASRPGQMVLRLATKELTGDHLIAWQHYFGDKLSGRTSELAGFNQVVIRVRTDNPEPVKVKVSLIDQNAAAFAATVSATGQFQDLVIPVSSLKRTSFLLLPRPYPGFHPLRFENTGAREFRMELAEKLEVSLGGELSGNDLKKPYSLEVESVWLQKK